MALVDGSNNSVATYTYSPYGEVLTATGTLANINPLRYRGYYYDTETSLYYLQSRYYDPATGRFLNTDGYASTGQGLFGYNMYAYCGNNPVSRNDDGGEFWNIVIGAVVGGALELGGQLLSGKSLSEVNWKKVGVATLSGGVSAAVGPVAGCFVSGATDVAMDALDGDIDSVGDAVGTFAWGTAKSLASYGAGTVLGKATKSLSKVEKVGRIGDDRYLGIQYSYSKGQGRAVRSIELHPNHNGHGIHLQGNKWNPKTGKRGGTFLRVTLWNGSD